MYAEGELRSNLDDSDRVRDLQDKVAELKAEVIIIFKNNILSVINKINYEKVVTRLYLFINIY